MDQKGLNQPVTTGGVRLPTFYNGRVLTAEDLQQLQASEGALRQQVARAGGSGIAWGLTCTPGTKTIVVDAGLAVGADGSLLYLANPVEVAIAGITSQTATTVGFQACGLQSAPLTTTGEAPYLLVACPAQVAVDASPQVWPTSAGKISTCGPGSIELGLQFRLLALPWGGSPAEFVGLKASTSATAKLATPVPGAKALAAAPAPGPTPIESPPIIAIPEDDLGYWSKLQNALALECYDLGTLPYGESRVGSFAAAQLRADGLLGMNEVPLCLFYWRSGQIQFLDQWAVRRRVEQPMIGLEGVGPLQVSEGEALWQQFQAHLTDLDLEAKESSEARTWFQKIPAAGFIPATVTESFFNGLYFWQGYLSPAQVRLKLWESYLSDPIDLSDPYSRPINYIYLSEETAFYYTDSSYNNYVAPTPEEEEPVVKEEEPVAEEKGDLTIELRADGGVETERLLSGAKVTAIDEAGSTYTASLKRSGQFDTALLGKVSSANLSVLGQAKAIAPEVVQAFADRPVRAKAIPQSQAKAMRESQSAVIQGYSINEAQIVTASEAVLNQSEIIKAISEGEISGIKTGTIKGPLVDLDEIQVLPPAGDSPPIKADPGTAVQFELKGLPPGNYTVQVKAKGFRGASKKVTALTGISGLLSFKLLAGSETDVIDGLRDHVAKKGRRGWKADFLPGGWWGRGWAVPAAVKYPVEIPKGWERVSDLPSAVLLDLVESGEEVQAKYPKAAVDPGAVEIWLNPDHTPASTAKEPYAWALFGKGGAGVPLILTGTDLTLDRSVGITKVEIEGTLDEQALSALGIADADALTGVWTDLLVQVLDQPIKEVLHLIKTARTAIDAIKGTAKEWAPEKPAVADALADKGLVDATKLANQRPEVLVEELKTKGVAVKDWEVEKLVAEARNVAPESTWKVEAVKELSKAQSEALVANGIVTQEELKVVAQADPAKVAQVTGMKVEEVPKVVKAIEAVQTEAAATKVAVQPVTKVVETESTAIALGKAGLGTVGALAKADVRAVTAALGGDSKAATKVVNLAKSQFRR